MRSAILFPKRFLLCLCAATLLSSLPAAGDETFDLPLTTQFGVTSSQSYAGLVEVRLSGTGGTNPGELIDPFYLFELPPGTSILPSSHAGTRISRSECACAPGEGDGHEECASPDIIDFIVAIEGVTVARGTRPPYRSDHSYQFVIDLGETPAPVTIGIHDCGVFDNYGAFQLSLSQLEAATPTVTATSTATETPTDIPPSTTPTATPKAGCPAEPSDNCYGASRSSLRAKNVGDPARRRFVWKWDKGLLTLGLGDLGNPFIDTGYALCLYDHTAGMPVLRLGASIPPGGTCGLHSCWWHLGGGAGFRYSYRSGNEDGIVKFWIRSGAAGKSKLLVKAAGQLLPLPDPISNSKYFDQDPAVIVQLHASNPANCWSSTFTATKMNNETQFKATAP